MDKQERDELEAEAKEKRQRAGFQAGLAFGALGSLTNGVPATAAEAEREENILRSAASSMSVAKALLRDVEASEQVLRRSQPSEIPR